MMRPKTLPIAQKNSVHTYLQLIQSNRICRIFLFFFFNDTAPTEIYPLSLPDALPIWAVGILRLRLPLRLRLQRQVCRGGRQRRGQVEQGEGPVLARPAVGTAGIFTRGRVAGSLALPRSDLTSAAIAFVAVAVVGFDNGGYLAHSWGWMVLAFSSVIAFALLLRPRISLGRLEWIALAALVALATWMFVSGAWGTAGTEPAREAERALVYVSGLGALLTVVETRSVHALLVGIVGATTALALYGLGDRVIEGPAQHPFEGRLLIEPLGYANALGILCAVGLVVAAGLALDERRAIVLLQLAAAAAALLIAPGLSSRRA